MNEEDLENDVTTLPLLFMHSNHHQFKVCDVEDSAL